MARVGRPVVGVLVVLLALASGAAHLRLRDDRIGLGDRGRATAEADPDCRFLHVRVDDLLLRGEGPTVRTEWRGETVVGTVQLDEHTTEDGVAGTFTAEDGTTVEVEGGVEGEHFFTVPCPMWSGP